MQAHGWVSKELLRSGGYVSNTLTEVSVSRVPLPSVQTGEVTVQSLTDAVGLTPPDSVGHRRLHEPSSSSFSIQSKIIFGNLPTVKVKVADSN